MSHVPTIQRPAVARNAFARTRRALAGSGLVLVLALSLLCSPLTSPSTALAKRPCLLDSLNHGRGSALAIARASDNESEEEETEGEETAAEEEATIEAEAEEEAEEEAEQGGPSSVVAGQTHSPGSPSTRHHGSSNPDAPIVSRLALTSKGTAALKHRGPRASVVEFSFTLSAPATVHVTLVKQTTSHGHKGWTTLPDSMTTKAGKGRASHKLTGHNKLSGGRYRLTVKPTTGRSRSIYLSARQ